MKLLLSRFLVCSIVTFAGCGDRGKSSVSDDCSPSVKRGKETRIIESEEYWGGTITNFYYVDPDAEFSMRRDAIELEPDHSDVFATIDDEVEKELEGNPRGLGFIHLFWATKKQILKEKYGILWRSLGDLNPNTSFD